jgi:hypothetical protein
VEIVVYQAEANALAHAINEIDYAHKQYWAEKNRERRLK